MPFAINDPTSGIEERGNSAPPFGNLDHVGLPNTVKASKGKYAGGGKLKVAPYVLTTGGSK